MWVKKNFEGCCRGFVENLAPILEDLSDMSATEREHKGEDGEPIHQVKDVLVYQLELQMCVLELCQSFQISSSVLIFAVFTSTTTR